MDIIAIIGVVITIITFIYQFHRKPKEKFSHLKIQFKATQRLSLQVQAELREFIEKYNAGNQFLMPGITYQAYLAQMERSFNENLSDRLLEEVESLKPSDNTIDSMLKSLETQFEALLQIDAQMRTILNFPNQITQ